MRRLGAAIGSVGLLALAACGTAKATTTEPVVQEGSSGPAVVLLQKDLDLLGFKLAVTGKFGAATKTAVLAFQAEVHKIHPNGIVGPWTWGKLEAAVAALPSPTPSTTSPSATPTPTPTTTGPVMPLGPPASQVGPLIANLNGSQILSQWPRLSYNTCDANGTLALDPSGDLALGTTGVGTNCAAVKDPDTYTSGIFEARIFFPANGGKLAEWPAYWLSSGWTPAPDPPWPWGGEYDAAEGFSNALNVTWDYNGTGNNPATDPYDPQQVGSFPITSTPGWHTVTVVWTTGEFQVYYDGVLANTITSHAENDPMQPIFDMTPGNNAGGPATLLVQYMRIWGVN